MWRRAAVWAALLALVLCGCGRSSFTSAAFCRSFLASYGVGEGGRYYDTAAPPTEATCLSDDLFATLFARADGTDDRDHVAEGTVWLCSRFGVVMEVGVFRCHDDTGADRMAESCYRRLALLRRALPEVDNAAAAEGFVLQAGRTVIYCVLPDGARAHRILERML